MRRFEALKPDQRTALILLGLGCSYAEIGALRGWTYTKVNRCISEGRAALRRRRALLQMSAGPAPGSRCLPILARLRRASGRRIARPPGASPDQEALMESTMSKRSCPQTGSLDPRVLLPALLPRLCCAATRRSC